VTHALTRPLLRRTVHEMDLFAEFAVVLVGVGAAAVVESPAIA
jgi:hypothetical protein